MVLRAYVAGLLLAAIATALAVQDAAAKRLALVVGNAAYEHLSPLRNTTIDADSKAENDFVYDMIAEDDTYFDYGSDKNGSWKSGPLIGLVQSKGAKEPRGGWRWRNGEPLDYQAWGAYQPDNWGGDEDYGHFHAYRTGRFDLHDTRADRWNDTNGADGFIMELELE